MKNITPAHQIKTRSWINWNNKFLRQIVNLKETVQIRFKRPLKGHWKPSTGQKYKADLKPLRQNIMPSQPQECQKLSLSLPKYGRPQKLKHKHRTLWCIMQRLALKFLSMRLNYYQAQNKHSHKMFYNQRKHNTSEYNFSILFKYFQVFDSILQHFTQFLLSCHSSLYVSNSS